MKVAMVCDYPLKEKRGGASVYVNRLSYHMSHIKDIEVHIITIANENKQFKKDNLLIHTIKRVFPFLLYTPIETWLLKRKILKIDPDIVHIQGTHYAYSPSAVFVRNKYPNIMTVFGIITKEIEYERESIRWRWLLQIFIRTLITKLTNKHQPNILAKEIKYDIIKIFIGFIRWWIARPIEKYVISKIPNIIVETTSIKDLISKWTNSKIYIAPAGIEYKKIQKIYSHLNEKTDIFLAVILYKIKGIDLLIKAVQIVLKSTPNLSVCIAGSGPYENELKNLVKRLNLEGHVKFLGFIPEEDKYQYYRACKLVVVPSRWDCQPITLLEAMSSGKPVIASSIGGIPDTVEDRKTGLLFEPENTDDLADKIVTLLKDEELREEMGKAAKVKAKEYDWSKIAERTLEIYKEVIADFHEQKAK